jgi:hypothetical protein
MDGVVEDPWANYRAAAGGPPGMPRRQTSHFFGREAWPWSSICSSSPSSPSLFFLLLFNLRLHDAAIPCAGRRPKSKDGIDFYDLSVPFAGRTCVLLANTRSIAPVGLCPRHLQCGDIQDGTAHVAEYDSCSRGLLGFVWTRRYCVPSLLSQLPSGPDHHDTDSPSIWVSIYALEGQLSISPLLPS